MEDEINPAPEANGTSPSPEPGVIDYKAKYEEVTKVHEDLTNQYKNLQREIAKRERSGQSTSKLEADMADIRTSLGVLTDALASVVSDEKIATKLKGHVTEADTKSRQREVAQRAVEDLSEIAEDAGFDSFDEFWDKPEMSKARDAWKRGDALSAITEANRAVRKGLKKADPLPTPPKEPKVVSPLDSGGPSAGARGKKSEELAKVDVNKMSLTELKAHEEAIYTALEKELGTKFKR